MMQYSSAILMGTAYGLLHVVGPDHLGTLVALSVANPPKAAFTVGVAWALGHSAGMVLVAGVILFLQKMARIDVEAWEHFGDYIIGLSMVLCGLYFFHREDELLIERDDGTFEIKGCCSSGSHGDSASVGLTKGQSGSGKPSCCANSTGCCASYGTMAEKRGDLEESPFLVASETGEPSNNAEVSSQTNLPSCCGSLSILALSNPDVEGAMLGVVQGLCCPMGLLGVAFLAKLRAGQAAVFVVMFLFMSAISTGALAFTWSWLVSNEVVTRAVPTKVLYRGSCFFTIGLGLAWVMANYFNVLSNLNYGEHHHMGGNMGDEAPAFIRLIQHLNMNGSEEW